MSGWLKVYKNTFEARGGLVGTLFGGSTDGWVVVVILALVAASLYRTEQQRDQKEEEARQEFLAKCAADAQITSECALLLQRNGKQCYRMSDFVDNTRLGVKFDQFYACTTQSYDVWVEFMRAQKKKELQKSRRGEIP